MCNSKISSKTSGPDTILVDLHGIFIKVYKFHKQYSELNLFFVVKTMLEIKAAS